MTIHRLRKPFGGASAAPPRPKLLKDPKAAEAKAEAKAAAEEKAMEMLKEKEKEKELPGEEKG